MHGTLLLVTRAACIASSDRECLAAALITMPGIDTNRSI